MLRSGPTHHGNLCHAGLQNSLPVKQFLQSCSAVISRDPKVFLEAVLATCSIKESAGRPLIVLRKPKVCAACMVFSNHSTPVKERFVWKAVEFS